MTTTLPRVSKSGFAVVDQPIALNRPGRVRFQGTYWKAELADSNCQQVGVGETVRVVGRQGIALLVVPESYDLVQTRKAVGFKKLASTISTALRESYRKELGEI